MAQVKRFSLDLGQPMQPAHARQIVASNLDEVHPGLLMAMMNYQIVDDRKCTKTSYPPVQFGYSHKGFCLYGFGAEGIEVLDDAAPLIHRVMSEKCKRVIQTDSTVMEMGAERMSYPLRYTVPAMVVQKKPRHRKSLDDLETGKLFIEQLFRRSIELQAQALSIELPKFDVSFVGAKNIAPMFRYRPNLPKLRGLHGAQFDVNLRLSGIWGVGYALGNGFGHFNATMQRGLMQ